MLRRKREVRRESMLGPLQVAPQLILALEEDEFETVADKAATTSPSGGGAKFI